MAGVLTRAKSKQLQQELQSKQDSSNTENVGASEQKEKGIVPGHPSEREVIGHETSPSRVISPRSTRSKHGSHSKSKKSFASNSSSRRSIVEARKAAKRAEIQLEAAKHEAEIREREITLENERKIQERQLELDIKRADLEIEELEESLSSSVSSSEDCFETLDDEKESVAKGYIVPCFLESELSNFPKESGKDRVERYFASSPVGGQLQGQDNNVNKPQLSNAAESSAAKYDLSSLRMLGKEIAKQRKP